jgi:hypothetical protein
VEDREQADKRSSPRSPSYAKVQLEGGGAFGYLRELSQGGCRLSLLGPTALAEEGDVALRVIPAPESGVPPFAMAVEVKWSRESPPYLLVGGTTRAIGGKEAEAALERLLLYYAG